MRLNRRLRFLGVATILLTHVALVRAADDFPGIKIGEKAPEFTLKDQSGADQSLSKLRKEKPVAVVFHRSADW